MSIDSLMRKAGKLAKSGDRAGAEALVRQVLAKKPGHKRALAAMAALTRGAPAQPSRAASGPAPAMLAALGRRLQAGDARGVLAEGQRLLIAHPHAAPVLNLVALAQDRLGQKDAAFATTDRLLAQSPDFPPALVNKARMLIERGQFSDAEPLLTRALARDPRMHSAYLVLGFALVQLGRADEALKPLRQAVKLAPRDPQAQMGLGNALAAADRPDDAIKVYEAALALAPAHPDVTLNLANSLLDTRRAPEALERLDAALARHPAHPKLTVTRVRALYDSEDVDGTRAACAALLADDADNLDVLKLAARVERETGDTAAALVFIDRALAINPDDIGAIAQRGLIAPLSPDDPDFARLGALASDASLSKTQQSLVELALFNGADAAGQPDLAYPHLARAKALRGAAHPYKIAKRRALFDAVKATFDTPLLLDADGVAARPAAQRPLFIVGMPRSGTTLVEQILAGHDDVRAGGEMVALSHAVGKAGWNGLQPGPRPDPAALARLRASYLDALDRLASDRPVLTDKMPLNFRWLGFALAALPEARAVFMLRDARATCWSNFRQSFRGQANDFGNSQTDTAAMYRLHLDLMAHWQSLYPDRITTIHYEALTEAPEVEGRKLVEAMGLDWDANLLEFSKRKRAVRTASALQVRKGIYTGSSDAWRAYDAHLGPMLAGLDGLD